MAIETSDSDEATIVADDHAHPAGRGGLRVTYFWWPAGSRFWLFTIYDKDATNDLTAQAALLVRMVARYPDTVKRLAAV